MEWAAGPLSRFGDGRESEHGPGGDEGYATDRRDGSQDAHAADGESIEASGEDYNSDGQEPADTV